MKRQWLPYYISRIVLSLGLSVLVLGFTWKAVVLALFFFALFLLYLHSGWFQVDATRPVFPLRRDERGREIQRKALIAALISGVTLFLVLTALPIGDSVRGGAGALAMALGAGVYFVVQFALFARP